MKQPLAPRASAPLKAQAERVIITRVWTDDEGQERTIDIIERVKPGLLRTYRETRSYKSAELPRRS